VVWRKVRGGRPKSAGAGRPVRAVVQFLVTVCVAAVFYLFERPVIACVAVGIGTVVLLSGLLLPSVFDAIERLGRALGRWVGAGMTCLVLVPFFYVVFATARLILRVCGKDPMCRAWPTKQETYWIPRPPVKDLRHYRNQH